MFKIEKSVSEAVSNVFVIKEFKDMETVDGKTVSVISSTRNIRKEDIERENENLDRQLDSIGEQKEKNLSILKEMSDLTLEVKSV